MSKSRLAVINLCVLVALTGCAGSDFPKTYKVSGTVTLDGKPVDGAMVTFLPAAGQKVAIGSTNADGQFKLSTFNPSDGAQPGGYKVTITKFFAPPTGSPPPLEPGVLADGNITESYAPPKANEKTEANKDKNLLPEKYASDATSGLIATVAENNNNNFDFDL